MADKVKGASMILTLHDVEGKDMQEVVAEIAKRLARYAPAMNWDVDIDVDEETIRGGAGEVVTTFYRATVRARLLSPSLPAGDTSV